MEPLSENLAELIAQKDRIASEVNSQSEKITAIKSDIYDILESDEIPKSFGAKLVDGSLTEITAEDLEGATKIRNYGFYRSAVTSIIIPNSVTSIGQSAFNDCSSLTSVTIGNGVTTIGANAFQYCSKLQIIVIGNGVTNIERYAFETSNQANGGTTVKFLGTTPPSIASNSFSKVYPIQIIVPKGYGEVYKSATNFSNFADYIVEATE